MANQSSDGEGIFVCPEAFLACTSKLDAVSQDLGEGKSSFCSAGDALAASWTCQSGAEFKSVQELLIDALECEASNLDRWCSALKSGQAAFETKDQALASSLGG